MNFQRGFRRLAWVLTALCSPFVFLLIYDRSNHVATWIPYRLDSPATARGEAIAGKAVEVQNLGLVHFPDAFPVSDVSDYLQQHFTRKSNPSSFIVPPGKLSISEFAKQVRAKHPEYTEPNDVKLTVHILQKYPEYRDWVAYSEYILVPHHEKRALWAVEVSTVVLVAMAAALQGAISVAAWVLRGFSAAG
jgi:hypothetical protein